MPVPASGNEILTNPPASYEAPLVIVWDKDSLTALAEDEADKYGLNESHFTKVIQCESNWNPKALGDDGNSRGLVQISSIYHPEVTDTEAYDPTFAVHFTAEEWAAGHERSWSCFRILAGRGWQ